MFEVQNTLAGLLCLSLPFAFGIAYLLARRNGRSRGTSAGIGVGLFLAVFTAFVIIAPSREQTEAHERQQLLDQQPTDVERVESLVSTLMASMDGDAFDMGTLNQAIEVFEKYEEAGVDLGLSPDSQEFLLRARDAVREVTAKQEAEAKKAAEQARAKALENEKRSAAEQFENQRLRESCRTVVAKFTGDRRTSVQKKAEWKKYDNRPFRWSMEVVEVQEKLLGGYRVGAKCPGSSAFTFDVVVDLPRNAEDLALSLNAGRRHTFTGHLRGYGTYLDTEWTPDPKRE